MYNINMRDNLLTKFKEVLSGTPITLVLHSSLVNLMSGKDTETVRSPHGSQVLSLK